MLESGIKGQPESEMKGQYESGIKGPISVGFKGAKGNELQINTGVFYIQKSLLRDQRMFYTWKAAKPPRKEEHDRESE